MYENFINTLNELWHEISEQHLEFLSLKGDCTGSSESTLVKYHIVVNHMSRLKCVLITAKKVQFSEEVQVKTIELPDEVDIDEVSDRFR